MRGKVRIDDLQNWFENPEEELENFLQSGRAIMNLLFPNSTRPIELNQRDVANLLIKIRANKPWKCEYCQIYNFGTEPDCLMCSAPRYW